MRKCRTCGKKLQGREKKYCKTCFEFHLHRYPKEKRDQLLKEYERLNQ